MRSKCNEKVVRSWTELMEVFASDAAHEKKIGRFRSDKVYRGMSLATWEVSTSLQRVNPDRAVERHLFRNFKKYAPQKSVTFNIFWNWLTLAQHHGLPTRLLDWTYSPFIALHFALDNFLHFDGDAAIWSVNLEYLKNKLPVGIKNKLKEDGGYSFSIDTLTELWPSLEALTIKRGKDFPIFFEPPSISDRIINQYALLSTTRNPNTIVSDWLLNYPDMYRKIIIPYSLKWEFRDRLDQLNITERIIFPGLDGLCSWLKRWYYSGNDRQVKKAIK